MPNLKYRVQASQAILQKAMPDLLEYMEGKTRLAYSEYKHLERTIVKKHANRRSVEVRDEFRIALINAAVRCVQVNRIVDRVLSEAMPEIRVWATSRYYITPWDYDWYERHITAMYARTYDVDVQIAFGKAVTKAVRFLNEAHRKEGYF